MTSLRRHPWARWAVPLAVAAAIGAGAGLTAAQAGATPRLDPKTPAQLLAMIEQAHVPAFTGIVTSTADVGLPALPSGSGPSVEPTDPYSLAQTLLAGTNTVRVWQDGPKKVRAQLVGTLAETDLVRNNQDVWLYSARRNTVTHVSLPAVPAGEEHAKTAPSASEPTPPTPQALAERMLAAVDPTTAVTVGQNVRVANHDAYQLVLTPRTSSTLIGQVAIAVDGSSGVPLRVSVNARGSDHPALEVGFTQFIPGTPPASRFTFSTPRGATVQEVSPPANPKGARDNLNKAPAPGQRLAPVPMSPLPGSRVIGSGWSAVLSLPAGTARLGASPSAKGEAQGQRLLDQASRPVAGGRMISTSLLTVLLMDDGRLLAGAVPPATLLADAG